MSLGETCTTLETPKKSKCSWWSEGLSVRCAGQEQESADRACVDALKGESDQLLSGHGHWVDLCQSEGALPVSAGSVSCN